MLHATFGVSNLAGANPIDSTCLLHPPSTGTIHHCSDPVDLGWIHGHLLVLDQPVQAGWVSHQAVHQTLPSFSLQSFSLPSFDVLNWKNYSSEMHGGIDLKKQWDQCVGPVFELGVLTTLSAAGASSWVSPFPLGTRYRRSYLYRTKRKMCRTPSEKSTILPGILLSRCCSNRRVIRLRFAIPNPCRYGTSFVQVPLKLTIVQVFHPMDREPWPKCLQSMKAKSVDTRSP